MNRDTLKSGQRLLLFQRNLFLCLTLILSVSTVILSSFLFLKQERTLICPPVIERAFWVERNKVDPTYLEQFGAFISGLLLGKSTHTSPSQRNDLLRHTDPSFSATLKKKLLAEEEMLNQQNAAYVFYPKTIRANPNALEVTIEGERTFFVGESIVSQSSEAYTLTFRYSGGRLLLNGIKAKEVEDV